MPLIAEKGRCRLWWDEDNGWVVEMFTASPRGKYLHFPNEKLAREAFEKLSEE